jgi:hypothetical protein
MSAHQAVHEGSTRSPTRRWQCEHARRCEGSESHFVEVHAKMDAVFVIPLALASFLVVRWCAPVSLYPACVPRGVGSWLASRSETRTRAG